ncbi:molybdopterin dinucleotide binding domain-containing protein [Streptomyces antimycoticus]
MFARRAGFATPTGRVELYSQRLFDHGYSPLPESAGPPTDPDLPLTLSCAKNGYFCHSQHRGLSSLRKRSPEPLVDIGERAAADRDIADGALVEITARNAAVRMRVRVDPGPHPDTVVAEYGWWQSAPDLALPGSDPLAGGEQNYNLLIDNTSHDPISGSVPLRSTPCDVRRIPTGTWSGPREFVVESAGDVTEDIRELLLRPADGGPLPEFRPGRHITPRRSRRPGHHPGVLADRRGTERRSRNVSACGPTDRRRCVLPGRAPRLDRRADGTWRPEVRHLR